MATTTQATTDDSVREDVLSELKWDPRISSENDIAVAVKDKVVTLSGFVPTFWDKEQPKGRLSVSTE
jgi:osmotically-inducible protein OsmY